MSSADKHPKTERLTLRCTPLQLEKWQQAAIDSRRDLLDWIRLHLDDAAARDVKSGPGKRG
jgi:hypothetical protein